MINMAIEQKQGKKDEETALFYPVYETLFYYFIFLNT